MQNENDDRRVKYTRMVLEDSLIELLQKKHIDKISVKEICEKADINRSTFYAHYSDPNDLLQRIVQSAMNDLNDYMDNFSYLDSGAESIQIISRIFEYIIANAGLFKVILGENGDIALQKKIMMIVQQEGMKDWWSKIELNEEFVEYLLLFGVNGSVGIVQKWLQNGMKQSASEMAEIIVTLTFKGYSAYIKP